MKEMNRLRQGCGQDSDREFRVAGGERDGMEHVGRVWIEEINCLQQGCGEWIGEKRLGSEEVGIRKS